MLREIKKITQSNTKKRKRWFSDPDIDLMVWQENDGSISRFELSLDKGINEHALTWKKNQGLQHYRVDDGENCPMHHKMSPLLKPDNARSIGGIQKDFSAAAESIDKGIADFIKTRLVLDEKKAKQ
ncbi:MAG: hypothetical protein KJO35_05600 [Gammaproteobacteria bacterium]|nr:hypothetical protein [Gammaproteobacteria bacterium]